MKYRKTEDCIVYGKLHGQTVEIPLAGFTSPRSARAYMKQNQKYYNDMHIKLVHYKPATE